MRTIAPLITVLFLGAMHVKLAFKKGSPQTSLQSCAGDLFPAIPGREPATKATLRIPTRA